MVQLSKEISIYNSKVDAAFIQLFRINFNFNQKPNRGADKVIFNHEQLKRVMEKCPISHDPLQFLQLVCKEVGSKKRLN